MEGRVRNVSLARGEQASRHAKVGAAAAAPRRSSGGIVLLRLVLGEHEELGGDEIGGVDRLPVLLVGAVADAAPDMDEIAGGAVGVDPADGALGEDGDGVPMGIGVLGAIVLLARIVRGDVDLEGRADGSDATGCVR